MSNQQKLSSKSPFVNVLKKTDLTSYFQEVSPGKIQILLLLCCSIYLSKTSCLYKCADELGHLLDAELADDSYYQILLRFFKTGKGEFLLEGIFRIIVYLLWLHGEGVLLMDRTNWECGKHKMINLLVIGIVYKGVMIPLVWQDLDRAGNSSCKERLDLVDKLLTWWQRSGLELPTLYMVGDREFIGKDWLKGLQDRGLYYVLRLKANRKFELWHRYDSGKKKVSLSVINRWMDRYSKDYAEVVIGDEIIANIVIRPLEKSKKGERYLYLITNIDQSQIAGDLYRVRWQIETCFKHLKSNGFNLEAMSMKQTHKVELIFGVLALTYTLAIKEGLLVYENKVKKGYQVMKTYKNGRQKLKKSIFRKGLSKIKSKIFDLKSGSKYFIAIFKEIKQKLLKNNIKHIIET